ncbi:MAG: hypothetical protein AB9M60_14845 [Leptothrix sp. (in: b-proteobacteria)]
MVGRLIRIHAEAPDKPAPGAPCNGCGVCCLAEPCPLGVLVSGHRTGACSALEWDESTKRYRCGMVNTPQQHLPGWLGPVAPLTRRLALRMIAAGSGCDCDFELE